MGRRQPPIIIQRLSKRLHRKRRNSRIHIRPAKRTRRPPRHHRICPAAKRSRPRLVPLRPNHVRGRQRVSLLVPGRPPLRRLHDQQKPRHSNRPTQPRTARHPIRRQLTHTHRHGQLLQKLRIQRLGPPGLCHRHHIHPLHPKRKQLVRATKQSPGNQRQHHIAHHQTPKPTHPPGKNPKFRKLR